MILPEEIENNINKYDNSIEAVCLKKDNYLYGESFDIFIKIDKTKNKIQQKLEIFKFSKHDYELNGKKSQACILYT